MTDLTLTAIQALSPEEQEQFKGYINQSLRRMRSRQSAINRLLETDFERKQNEF
ncbi:hypothetical protein LCGC14_0376130 [marine sediment metagenome]|uniref:Uncharacterized protein n=1 Tax=marine sediment metagenome TaxID=412755 RepID=A0A0F9T3T9_9ZZZZ